MPMKRTSSCSEAHAAGEDGCAPKLFDIKKRNPSRILLKPWQVQLHRTHLPIELSCSHTNMTENLTPRIERLLREGLQQTDAPCDYIPSSGTELQYPLVSALCTRCSVTRKSLFAKEDGIARRRKDCSRLLFSVRGYALCFVFLREISSACSYVDAAWDHERIESWLKLSSIEYYMRRLSPGMVEIQVNSRMNSRIYNRNSNSGSASLYHPLQSLFYHVAR
jgi:hypothetical protein